MEMQLGGPVWHASAASLPGTNRPAQILRAAAMKALNGVGDTSRGEWEEWTGRAYHVRRRLSAREQRSVGEVVDVRGTPEADHRLTRVRRWLPSGYLEVSP
jgi:hypothetical protein